MKRIVASLIVFLLAFPLASIALAAGEAAVVRKLFEDCRRSGGRPSANNYNDWVAGGGCICPGSTRGSGQATCPSGSGSSGGGASTGASGDIITDSTSHVVQGIMSGNSQQMGLGMMGLGVGMLLQGAQGDPAADARRAREAAQAAELARQEEARRYAEALRQQELAKQRILGLLKGSDPSDVVALKTGDSDSSLRVTETRGPFGSTEIKPIGIDSPSDEHVLKLKLGDDLQVRETGKTIGQADEINAAATTEEARIIKGMNALAKRLGWSEDEQARLNNALNSLNSDGDPDATSDHIIDAWNDVLARGQGADFAREAANGEGPGLFTGAGTQSFNDCAVFALANAAGLPYGVVAARATKLIDEGEWRSKADRANPQKAIEKKGLNGGEVIMLAESFGQAEVVPSSAFAKTLKEGRPVMVNVVPEDGNVKNGHEVVLTKTFQHNGETWYEMMDSNQGALERRYLSAKELGTILQENGVAFRPDTGTTPKLLR